VVACAERLYETYRKRYVDKQFIQLPPNEHAVLKACHERYMCDREGSQSSPTSRPPRVRSVTPLEVLSVLNKQSAISLNRMLNGSAHVRA
jgi:hypothetical protein